MNEIVAAEQQCIQTARANGHNRVIARNCEEYSVACPNCPLAQTVDERRMLAEAIHNAAWERYNSAQTLGEKLAAEKEVIRARNQIVSTGGVFNLLRSNT